MSDRPAWYDQCLYEQAWENYRNEDDNYRTILTQYLVFVAAFVYAASQATEPQTAKVLGAIGAIASLLAFFYVGRIARYSRAWLAAKDAAIGATLAASERQHHTDAAKSLSVLSVASFIPGYLLI